MDKKKYSLSVLYVEDEEQIALLVSEYLRKRYESVYVAKDGEEGLALFVKYSPDIVITDVQMPKKNGLELSREIRKISKSVPIIITTAFDDSKYLWDAIRTGINHYIIKPLDSGELREILNQTSIAILEKRELEEARELRIKAKEQEIELLKYREKYHSSQQEGAFKKQLKIIVDELNRRYENDVFVETYYKPIDILSGDSYGSIEISDGLYFFYIIDAMGKGLSASVTSIQSMAFINHAARVSYNKGNFEFERIINDYLLFIKAHLIEYEMVCAHFLLLDTNEMKMSYSSFGMPPILIQKKSGEIVEVRTNNPPIMDIFGTLEITQIDIKDACKIVAFSDGVDESYMPCGELYAKRMNEDLKESCCLKNLLELFYKHTSEQKDDISMIFIKFDEFESCGYFECESTILSLDKMSAQIINKAASLGFGESFLGELMCAATEMLMNALEHGNFGIDYNSKKRMTEEGHYDGYLNSLLENQEFTQKKIRAQVSISSSTNRVLRVEIIDEGDGFAFGEFFKYMSFDDIIRYSGRGIIMTESMVDGIFYNKKGNRVVILKSEDGKGV